MRHLFEALVGDAAAARDVAEEGDDVVLTLRAAEARQQDPVVGDGLLDVRGARLHRGRSERHRLPNGTVSTSTLVLTRSAATRPS